MSVAPCGMVWWKIALESVQQFIFIKTGRLGRQANRLIVPVACQVNYWSGNIIVYLDLNTDFNWNGSLTSQLNSTFKFLIGNKTTDPTKYTVLKSKCKTFLPWSSCSCASPSCGWKSDLHKVDLAQFS